MSVLPVNNNIPNIALDILAESRYGIKCKSNREPKLQLMQIMGNELDCDIKNLICLPKEKTCCDDVKTVFCNLTISPDAEYETQDGGILYILATVLSGVPAYTYSWTYNTTILELAPNETGTNVDLYLKWIDIGDLQNTTVTITVTDSKGCITTQSFSIEVI